MSYLVLLLGWIYQKRRNGSRYVYSFPSKCIAKQIPASRHCCLFLVDSHQARFDLGNGLHRAVDTMHCLFTSTSKYFLLSKGIERRAKQAEDSKVTIRACINISSPTDSGAKIVRVHTSTVGKDELTPSERSQSG